MHQINHTFYHVSHVMYLTVEIDACLCLFGVEIKVGQLRNPFPGRVFVCNKYL